MFRKILFYLLVAGCLTACGQQAEDSTAETGEPQSFGEQITADNAITYTEMIEQMQESDSMKVKVKGTVRGICQKKGCWMNISDGQTEKETFVKFKDYGFFMPMDIAGREVIMEGYAFREVTPVDELRHYAEDEGKSQEEIEAITEPVEELKFMASGVLLLPENKQ